MRALHLSDLHIPEQPGPSSHGIDTRAVLWQLLYHCRRLTDLDLIGVSGDLTDDGYTFARDPVQTFAHDQSAAQAWCVGNHDARDAFTAATTSVAQRRQAPGSAQPPARSTVCTSSLWTV